jgi:hypothetical protein
MCRVPVLLTLALRRLAVHLRRKIMAATLSARTPA